MNSSQTNLDPEGDLSRKIIQQDPVWAYNSVIDHTCGIPDADFYVEGFKKGANILTEKLLHDIDSGIENTKDLDTLIFPILFLYHHFIELRVKDIYMKSSDLQGKIVKPDGHDLEKLWKDCLKSLMELDNSEKQKEILNPINDFIQNLAFNNITAITMRYPYDKKYTQSFFGSNNVIVGLKSLYEGMNELAKTLDGLSFELSVRAQEF